MSRRKKNRALKIGDEDSISGVVFAGREAALRKPRIGVFVYSAMKTLEQIESEVRKLSPQEPEQLRDWLENLLEDRLELKDEFKAEIEAGKKDIAEGRYRIHKP